MNQPSVAADESQLRLIERLDVRADSRRLLQIMVPLGAGVPSLGLRGGRARGTKEPGAGISNGYVSGPDDATGRRPAGATAQGCVTMFNYLFRNMIRQPFSR
jgi:hypothetical protein